MAKFNRSRSSQIFGIPAFHLMEAFAFGRCGCECVERVGYSAERTDIVWIRGVGS